MFKLDDRRTIGVGLTGLGVVFSFVGILMFLDKGLIALGNILFLAGITLTIGPPATLRFFTRRKHYRGSACFLGGSALVIAGWTLLGLLLELYGFWLLFSGFFPTVLQYARRIPYLSQLLNLPVVRQVISRLAPASHQSLPV